MRELRGGRVAAALVLALLAGAVPRAAVAQDCRGDEQWHVVLTATHQYLDILSNWIVHFKRARETMRETPTVEIIAEDDESYEILSSPGYARFLPPDTSVTLGRKSDAEFKGDTSGKVTFSSQAFKALMARRGQYMTRAVQSHCRVVFTDSDVFWLRDPFQDFKGQCDLWAQVHVKKRTGGTFQDADNALNPGFAAVLRNERTVQVMEQWAELMAGGPTHNMGKFNQALEMVEGLRACQLEGEFPEGNMMEWQADWIEQNKPKVVHNNWVGRKDAKVSRFHSAGLWACDLRTCSDPAITARRNLHALAVNDRSSMSADSLWEVLVGHPELARTAGLASKPLEGSLPNPLPSGHGDERTLDRMLRVLGPSGFTPFPEKGFLEIFYH